MVLGFCSLFAVLLLVIQLVQLYGLPFNLYQGTVAERTNQQLEVLSAIADTRKGLLENWIRNNRQNARLIASNPDIQNLRPLNNRISLPPNLQQWLETMRDDYQLSAIKLHLASTGATVLAIPGAGQGTLGSEPDTVHAGFSEQLLVTYNTAHQTSLLHILVPVRPNGNPDQKPLLILDLEVSLQGFITDQLSVGLAGLMGKTAEILLLDSQRRFLSDARHSFSDGKHPVPLQAINPSRAAELAVSGSEGTIANHDYRGAPVLTAYRYIHLTPEVAWGMVVEQDQSEVYAGLLQAKRVYWLLGLAGIAVLIISALVMASNLTRPLRTMVATAGIIQSGDLSARADEDNKGEVGALAQAFNHMLDQLQNWHTELDRQVQLRTSQLSETNQELQEQVNERTRAEQTLHEKALLLEQEIAERQKVQEALQHAKLVAESGSRAKSEFLANMSHEIRTPMNGILGMAQLLEFTPLDEEQKGFLQAINFSTINLLRLLNDILDLSKIEAEKVEITPAPFSLRDCITELLTTQRSVLFKKGLDCSITIPNDLPDQLLGDQLRIKQILLNLLSNAIKFTEQGGINITATVVEHHGSTLLLDIAVQDSGIGIPENAQEQVFEAFTQADGSITRNFGGTGLGLTICRRLAELMGGSIRLESKEGSGSTFYLRIPLAIAAVDLHKNPRIDNALSDSGVPSLKILMAEDNPINILCIKALLKKSGHQVTVAENGKAALDLLKDQQFELVLLDIQMPLMNGDVALQLIREQEASTGAHLPTIALTAFALKGDKEKYLQMGFDGYLAKPVALSDMLDEIKRVVTATASSTRSA